MQTFGTEKARNWERLRDRGLRWGAPTPVDVLVGIDDTDNLDSPGTGFRARELVYLLEENGLGRAQGVTRHQLLVHPEVRYTSHNSAACIRLAEVSDIEAVKRLCRTYLAAESASGSDAGLCVVPRVSIPDAVCAWGAQAKLDVLHKTGAVALAAKHGIYLEGLTGDHGGMIGALAAVGLHRAGNDGRFLWLRNLRESSGRRLSVSELEQELGLVVATPAGVDIPLDHEWVALGEWPRAVFRNDSPVLYVERVNENADFQWRMVAKDFIKQF